MGKFEGFVHRKYEHYYMKTHLLQVMFHYRHDERDQWWWITSGGICASVFLSPSSVVYLSFSLVETHCVNCTMFANHKTKKLVFAP